LRTGEIEILVSRNEKFFSFAGGNRSEGLRGDICKKPPISPSMKVEDRMSRRLVPASVVLLASVLVSCSPFHRDQDAACKQRGAAYAARVRRLERDAHGELSIGTKKDAVIRFFQQNGIPVRFVGGEATGTIFTTGCAPDGCGSDTALIGLRVKVDDNGNVIAEPFVGALYTNCL
jgi:hypothetical protein